MPDLLTHVLGAYVLLTPVTWYVEWIDRRHVALLMIGSIVPDISKVRLVVGSSVVSDAIGQPWLWTGIHRIGPAGTLAAAGALGFERGRRLSGAGWLFAGVLLHLAFDLTVIRASAVAPPYLYPLTWWHPPAANVLLSSDLWPWMLTSVLAGVVWLVDHRLAG
jgi:hypothetical protein